MKSRHLEFGIDSWLTSACGDESERSTFAQLTITVGPNRIPLTEVHDTIARTTRPGIFVSVYPLAEWLLVNWWRLRHTVWRRSAAMQPGHPRPWQAMGSSSRSCPRRKTAPTLPPSATSAISTCKSLPANSSER